MPLPPLKDQFAALIAAPSVSCTQAALDQSNRQVIDLLQQIKKTGYSTDIRDKSAEAIQAIRRGVVALNN